MLRYILCVNQIPTYLDHIPEGTSTRPFVHYAQLYMSGEYDNWVFQRKELNFPIMSKEHSFAVIKACRQIWVLRLRLRKYGSLWPRFADNLWFVQGFICHFLQCHPDEWIVTGDCTNSNFQRGRRWFSGRARYRPIGENCLLFKQDHIRINVALVIKQSLVYIFTSMTFLDQRSSRTIEKLWWSFCAFLGDGEQKVDGRGWSS